MAFSIGGKVSSKLHYYKKDVAIYTLNILLFKRKMKYKTVFRFP